MAKPKQKGKASPAQSITSVPSLHNGIATYFPLLVLAITFICLFPSLQNKFVNLDDKQYVTDNPVIREMNGDNLKAIFSEQYLGNYQPIAMLSYMVDYKFFGLNSFGYHLTNLILHLLGTFFVFLIFRKLSGNDLVAFLTALLFGIHPLHVESVAWVAERKDVLYGFCFLWAFYLYILHAKQEKQFSKYLLFSLLLFVFALLSKAQAVVLPLTFFAADFLMKRRFSKKTIIEKTPFFVLAMIFGLIAIHVQGKAGAMQTFQYFPFYERILFSCYALMTYLHKLILPINLSCFYPYPETDDKINTIWVYVSPFVLVAIALLIWKFLRDSRVVLFGVAFFIISIALVLQLLPIGDALYADRYTYVPSIGLFFVVAHYLVPYFKNKMVLYLSVACMVSFCYLTFQRTKAWHDSITLYSDAIGNGYKAAIIYNNRGAVLSDSGKNELALNDFTSLVNLKPRYPNGWRNKGLIQIRLGKKEDAIRSFSEEIKISSEDASNYLSRGTLLEEKNDFDGAIRDFSKMIEINPKNGEGYYARAEALGKSGKLEAALTDINKAIEFAPDNGQAYNNRGIIFSMRGNYQDAVNDLTKSLQLKPDNIGAYTNRALAYKGMGKYAEALLDMQTAKEKGIAVDENSILELKKLLNTKK
ncbi:MAG TPA: tetratricopeptide repeat protein [Bacteroidia bacterium]